MLVRRPHAAIVQIGHDADAALVPLAFGGFFLKTQLHIVQTLHSGFEHEIAVRLAFLRCVRSGGASMRLAVPLSELFHFQP